MRKDLGQDDNWRKEEPGGPGSWAGQVNEQARPLRTWSYSASQALRYQSTGHVERSEIPHQGIGKRDRESDAGRFLSVDPLAEERHWLNPYNYVQGNPVIRVDPDGALDGEVCDDCPSNSRYDIFRNSNLEFTYNKNGSVSRVDDSEEHDTDESGKGLINDDEIFSFPNGGIDGMNVASKGLTALGIGTTLRYKLEWEYVKQARLNRAISGNFSQPIKHSLRSIRGLGTGITIANGFVGIIDFSLSKKSWGDYGRLGISLLSTGLTLGGPTAPIGIGLGAVDAFGGLNGLYKNLDKHEDFYNSTGVIIVPINNFPKVIRLK